ncbi:MAG: flavodoxin-dependent (E)-4-hydroxy-3-methylbut-2-enyl-diphosphate synthase [Chitinispirillaceae bacterium]|nr:flavodoxin-dependent (E)-4-hydroxy-3-methylbut-2-enyl-diphosphate synthase [Chitinispirillaceae bacterium]
MIERKKTRQIKVRDVCIGGGAPVVIQSMTNTDICDIEATLAQIGRLTAAGCQIVRIAVPDEKAAEAFGKIRRQTGVPLVADIHFQYQLAIRAIEAGADKVRINPGNIGSEERVRKVADAAKAARIPLRIGVNSGSLEKPLLDKYGSPSPRALLESSLGSLALLRRLGFEDVIVSIKASGAAATIDACRLLAEHSDVPQHIGVTEAGTVRSGSIRSAVGIGALLAEGIGDTIRVSLAGDPVEEIFTAKEILKALGLMPGPVVIACPTCGRTKIDVARLAEKVEKMVAPLTASIRIAVMGCVVNGPGEARDADLGVAGGEGEGLLFVKGQAVKKIKENQILAELKRHIEEMIKEKLK